MLNFSNWVWPKAGDPWFGVQIQGKIRLRPKTLGSNCQMRYADPAPYGSVCARCNQPQNYRDPFNDPNGTAGHMFILTLHMAITTQYSLPLSFDSDILAHQWQETIVFATSYWHEAPEPASMEFQKHYHPWSLEPHPGGGSGQSEDPAMAASCRSHSVGITGRRIPPICRCTKECADKKKKASIEKLKAKS